MRKRIAAKMDNQKGFSLIELIIVVLIIAIISVVAIPNLLASRRAANEASTIASLRTICGAEATYHSSLGGGEYGNLSDLNSGGLIDSVLGIAPNIKSGYQFNATATPRSAAQPAIFDITATPQQFGGNINGTGTRSFYTNESGVIYAIASPTAPFAISSTNRDISPGSGFALND